MIAVTATHRAAAAACNAAGTDFALPSSRRVLMKSKMKGVASADTKEPLGPFARLFRTLCGSLERVSEIALLLHVCGHEGVSAL